MSEEGWGVSEEGWGVCEEGWGVSEEGWGVSEEGWGVSEEGWGVSEEGWGVCEEGWGVGSNTSLRVRGLGPNSDVWTESLALYIFLNSSIYFTKHGKHGLDKLQIEY